jgi:hypothetical protein
MANSSRELRGISENLMCTINRFKLAWCKNLLWNAEASYA